MSDRDLAIVNDVRDCIVASGLVSQALTGTSLKLDPPAVPVLPAAFVLWRGTTERDLGSDGLRLATVLMEVVLRVSAQGAPTGRGRLEKLLRLKNDVADALGADPGRSGLADGVVQTEVKGARVMDTARNHYAECRLEVASDYVLVDDGQR